MKFLVKFLLIGAILSAVGRALSDKLTDGDEHSNEFSLATFFGGAERTSVASALRRGRIAIGFGGVDLDLRDATLDPAGADLDVKVCFGGMRLAVRDDWRVTVTEDAQAGGIDIDVTPHEDLPDDAPQLDIAVMARLGGVAVVTGS